MKIIDLYIGRHFVGPFLGGVAAFVAILLGVGPVFDAARLVVRDGMPPMLVVSIFLLRTPNIISLTLPMATVFAALMASGELCSHGEIVAMRAGGVSIWRLSRPVLVAAFMVTVVTFVFNEALGPACSNRATMMLQEYVMEKRDIDEPLTFRVPEHGEAKLLVYADKFSLREKSMTGVTLIQFKGLEPPDLYFAKRATWENEQWVLHDVTRKWKTKDGYAEVVSERARAPLAKSPEEMRSAGQRKPEDHRLGELLAEIRKLQPKGGVPTRGKDRGLQMLQHLHLRLAVPWAAICFAVLGFPLGMRPQRTSAGIGFGLSLAIVFVYYIVFNVLRAVGEQGAISPLLAAWMPNLLVLGAGLGMMIETSR